MPAPDAIPPDSLAKPLGPPRCPTILDNRRDGLRHEDPRLLARIVRGADTARADLASEVPGLSWMYPDDLELLEAGMALYDAFSRGCRDGTEETHNWPTNRPGGAA